MEIIFATNNKNKVSEVQQLLPNSIQIKSLKDIGCFEDIPETADTIEGNALQKANYVYQMYKENCFSDDTGFEVEALGNAPGVHSARYAGEDRSDFKNTEKLLNELNGQNNRKARFKTVIALVLNGKVITFEGIANGEILKERRGGNGFGYDPVFVPNGQTKTFAEMTLSEKNIFSHRAKAFQKLVEFLTQNVSK